MPTILSLFGVTGDLSQHKLLPALYTLFKEKQLPPQFRIIGFGRRAWSDDDFRKFVAETLLKQKGVTDESFLELLTYVSGDFAVAEDYKTLKTKFELLEKGFGEKASKLFYLAVPPSLYTDILSSIKHAKLDVVGKSEWCRLLIEKPFGLDIDSAKKLNKLALKFFKEKQLFRVDHYIAKESVQAILRFRQENRFLDSIWNNKYISKVEIQMLEELAVGQRGSFYDGVGALRDVGQNHLLQLLALIAMDKNVAQSGEAVRKARTKVLSSLISFKPSDVSKYAERGQYEGYLKEPGVKAGSQTETYFKVRAELSLSKWKKVPFYIESGKALSVSKVFVRVSFKGDSPDIPNTITFLIQPGKGIELSFGNDAQFTIPPTLETKKVFGAYEKIFLDAMKGDQTIFPHEKEIEAAWKFITPIVDNWSKTPLHIYKQKSI